MKTAFQDNWDAVFYVIIYLETKSFYFYDK